MPVAYKWYLQRSRACRALERKFCEVYEIPKNLQLSDVDLDEDSHASDDYDKTDDTNFHHNLELLYRTQLIQQRHSTFLRSPTGDLISSLYWSLYENAVKLIKSDDYCPEMTNYVAERATDYHDLVPLDHAVPFVGVLPV